MQHVLLQKMHVQFDDPPFRKKIIFTYFRSTFWGFGFLICFLIRLFLQLEHFLFKRKVSNARFFFLVQIARFKLVCANDRVF